MKKHTLPPETAPPPEKARKHGPDKEKVQVTVRIDKDVMDQAYAQMKITNSRITDLMERGLIREMRAQDQDLPLLTTQVRFLVDNTTKTEQEQLRDFLTFLRADEVRKPTDVDRSIRRFIADYLKTFLPLRKQAIDLYARYGRTEGEIEKLTG